MAKRRHKGPPLYDLITTHTRSRSAPAARPQPEPREPLDEDGPAPLGWINPGRTVAFPVGYGFVAAALALTIIVLAFVAGHQRGEAGAEARFDQTLLDSSRSADQARRTEDPLLASRTGRFDPPVSKADSSGISGQDPSNARSGSTSVGTGETARNYPLPIVQDPRASGRNYYVLATTQPDGAIRLAEFCRERGLEAYVVGGHNARFSQVIALPALESASSNDPLVRSLREQILRIGRQWERSEPGATDLSDAYIQLYRQ